jgi:hypothetical protein
MNTLFALASRRNAFAFWLGAVLVTIGVILHLPMFMMGKDMGYALAGMPMDAEMYWGMALIVLGIGCAAYGLIPAAAQGTRRSCRLRMRACPPRIGQPRSPSPSGSSSTS